MLVRRIELDFQPGRPQERFLEYLNSQIQSRMSKSEGTATIHDDGSFVSETSGVFRLPSEEVSLIWRLAWSAGDLLQYMEVFASGGPNNFSQDAAREIDGVIQNVMAATISGRERSFYRRVEFAYVGQALAGEYWFRQIRIAPIDVDDGELSHMLDERLICIDMVVSAIDEADANRVAFDAGSQWAARLSLLLDIGLYRVPSQFVWVTPRGDEDGFCTPVRAQRGRFGNSQQPPREMPKKGELCPQGTFDYTIADLRRSVQPSLSMPIEARKIFNSIDSADSQVYRAFDNASRLYQMANLVESQFPTVSLSYKIAAIDALSKFEGSKSAFKTFMRSNTKDTGQRDKILDSMWGNVRSSHFHAGEFPLGDHQAPRVSPIVDRKYVERSWLRFNSSMLIREALVTWLLRRLPDSDA